MAPRSYAFAPSLAATSGVDCTPAHNAKRRGLTAALHSGQWAVCQCDAVCRNAKAQKLTYVFSRADFLRKLRLCVARCGSGGRGSEWVGVKGSRVRLVRNEFALDFEFKDHRDVLLDELPDHFAAARALDAA